MEHKLAWNGGQLVVTGPDAAVTAIVQAIATGAEVPIGELVLRFDRLPQTEADLIADALGIPRGLSLQEALDEVRRRPPTPATPAGRNRL